MKSAPRSIWHDPVWSKVIAGLVLAAILAAVGYLRTSDFSWTVNASLWVWNVIVTQVWGAYLALVVAVYFWVRRSPRARAAAAAPLDDGTEERFQNIARMQAEAEILKFINSEGSTSPSVLAQNVGALAEVTNAHHKRIGVLEDAKAPLDQVQRETEIALAMGATSESTASPHLKNEFFRGWISEPDTQLPRDLPESRDSIVAFLEPYGRWKLKLMGNSAYAHFYRKGFSPSEIAVLTSKAIGVIRKNLSSGGYQV